MTNYEFEKAAKNAVTDILKNKYNIETSLEKLQIVWFSYTLGFKKCTLYEPGIGSYYAEVTFNRDADEIYVDIYLKQSNTKIPASEFNFNA